MVPNGVVDVAAPAVLVWRQFLCCFNRMRIVIIMKYSKITQFLCCPWGIFSTGSLMLFSACDSGSPGHWHTWFYIITVWTLKSWNMMPHLSVGLLCCDAMWSYTQLETFRMNMSIASSGWSDDGGDPFSKTLVTTYKITWHHDPEDHCWHLPPLWELQISNAYTLIFPVSGELRYLNVRAFCDIARCSLIGHYMVLYPRILSSYLPPWEPEIPFKYFNSEACSLDYGL
jgi:hypothetical protein